MQARTKSSFLIAGGSRASDTTGAFEPLEPQTEAIEIRINLTSITRTTTGTVQTRIEASYDDGANYEVVALGALNTAAFQERFVYPFSVGLAVSAATMADGGAFYQASPQNNPTAGQMRHHLKPHGYRAVADMEGDTTAYNVTVTLRQVTEV
jgi:hypothetical protein